MQGEARVEGGGEEPRVVLPAEVLTTLYEHAVERGRAGEECCGLVVASPERRYAAVVPCRNIMSQKHQHDPVAWPRDNRTAYFMHPEDLRDEDLAYVGNALFPFPAADQIVLSVHDRRVKAARLFRRAAPGEAFAPMAIEVEHA